MVFILVSCDPPKSSPPPKLSFRQGAVVTSRAHQTYTNELLVNGKPATGNVSYRIVAPTDFASKNIKIDENTGKLTFQEPVKVTVEATYAGKTATYTLTVIDHFSVRILSHSVAIGSGANAGIYVLGGISLGGYYQTDVWRSTDGGAVWKQVATGTRFSERFRHSAVVVGSDIYVIGGFNGVNRLNDVWKSTNGGATWSEVTTGTTLANTLFSARNNHSLVAVDSGSNAGIYVIGGSNGVNRLNDVWKSTDDGATWREVTTGTTGANTLFAARISHSSVAVDSGTHEGIYVIGGTHGTNRLNDVWKSTNGGATWNQVTVTGRQFSEISGHSSVTVGSDIYVIGGFTNAPTDEVWKSSNGGQTWTQVATTKFPARNVLNSAAIGSGPNAGIYVTGGISIGNSTYFNDVWKSTNSGVTWVNVRAKP